MTVIRERPPGPAVRRFVAEARRGVLATTTVTGEPRLVPICFVVADEPPGSHESQEPVTADRLTLYSALDEKPKRSADPLALGRVRDLETRPRASLLVDRWSEDWRRLAWVRLRCRGTIVQPGASSRSAHARAVATLREKYPQYRDQRLESRPLIRLDCSVAATWGRIDEAGDGTLGAPEEAKR